MVKFTCFLVKPAHKEIGLFVMIFYSHPDSGSGTIRLENFLLIDFPARLGQLIRN